MNAGKKVLSNTIVLYAKMLITVCISLYTTRVVLNALGAIDYGVFNLVIGVVAMLSFLNSAISTSTQRFLSVSQGTNDAAMLKKIFASSLLLHAGIGVLLLIVMEAFSFFLFDGWLNIPIDRIDTAKIIYHYMSITVFVTILSAPFMASLNAHENMLWIAIVGTIEVVLKLGIALLLLTIASDRLIFYGLSITLVSIASFLMFMIYCLNKYPECSLKNIKSSADIKLIKTLTSFASWNLFGALCAVGRSQGLAVVLNLFFGAVINAAYGIANQVSGQLNFFSATIVTAINPQIMKREGANDRRGMLLLSMAASKFAFFALACFSIPFIFEMPKILELWLKIVPENSVIFCQLMLISILMNQLTVGLQSALQATGRIKVYQSVVGTLILLNLPIAYVLLTIGYSSSSVLISSIIIELIACCIRIYLTKMIAGLSIRTYIQEVFMKLILPTCISIIVCFLIVTHIDVSSYRFLLTISISIVVFVVTIYFAALNVDEKKMVNSIISNLKSKII